MKKDEFPKNLPLSAYTTSTSHLTICGTISTVWWYIMHPMNNPTSTCVVLILVDWFDLIILI